MIGLGCLYRGMAIGAMGIVAPISATSPIVPLGVDLLRGRSPSAVQWVGIAFALAGIVLLSREPGKIRGAAAAGVGLALVAALAFGLLHRRNRRGGKGQRSLGGRHRPPQLRHCARRRPRVDAHRALACRRGSCRSSSLVGAFDAGANALIALAATRGAIGIVAVLSAFYPIATILLARAVLHERLGTDPNRRWADRPRWRSDDRRRAEISNQTLKRMFKTSPSCTT